MDCTHNNIPTDFRYCPYCGAEIKHEPSLDDLIAHRVNIGDEVRFMLNDGTEAAVVVVDNYANGIQCVMFEGVEDMAMYDGRHWVKVNSVNYPDSDMARKLTKFENNLPERLLCEIKKRRIKQVSDNTAREIVTRLYPLSIYEVFGDNMNSCGMRDANGERSIDFFVDNKNNRAKYLWCTWLRSPNSSNSSGFCIVNNTGTANYYYANHSYGAAPAFTI